MDCVETDAGSTAMNGGGLEQALFMLVQRALVPLAGRLAALEVELRGIRLAMEESGAAAAALPGDAGKVAPPPVEHATDAEVLYDPERGRSAPLGGSCSAGAIASPPTPMTSTSRAGAAASSPGRLLSSESAGGPSAAVGVMRLPSSEIPVASAILCSSPHQAQQTSVALAASERFPGAVRASSPDGDESRRSQDEPPHLRSAHRLQDIHRQESVASASPQSVEEYQGALAHAAVFFDFDSTLSTPRYIDRAKDYALVDRPALCASMTRSEILDNFGGPGRVARLHALLQRLSAKGIALFIVSLGYTEAIRHQLGVVGLGRFFPVGHVFGQDAPDFAQTQHRKAVLIQRLMELNGWSEDRVLFVDDDQGHVNLCREMGVCRALKVLGDGLSLEEIERIEATAADWAAPAAS